MSLTVTPLTCSLLAFDEFLAVLLHWNYSLTYYLIRVQQVGCLQILPNMFLVFYTSTLDLPLPSSSPVIVILLGLVLFLVRRSLRLPCAAISLEFTRQFQLKYESVPYICAAVYSLLMTLLLHYYY